MTGCAQCGGTSWIQFTKPVTAYDCDGNAIVVQNDYSRPCSCHPRNFVQADSAPAKRRRTTSTVRDGKAAAMGDE